MSVLEDLATPAHFTNLVARTAPAMLEETLPLAEARQPLGRFRACTAKVSVGVSLEPCQLPPTCALGLP